MRNAIVCVTTGKREAVRAWVPSNPGKAGVVDPKATFSPFPEHKKANPVSKVILERERRMYAVLPEFQQMQWEPAGSHPRVKHTSSLAMKEFSGGFQKAAIAITRAGRF